MKARLCVEGVRKRYEGALADVLAGVDLELAAGESVAVTGPSGSGKSTLLNIMGTLDRPSQGRVMLGDHDVLAMSAGPLARLRNRSIGFVFQQHHLLPQCTVVENVLVPALVHGDMTDAAIRARELLERVGLSHRLHHRPGQLSGGECQRVAVVRALINRPLVLLADEPTGSLDREASDAIGDLLAGLSREQGVAVVCVTHAERLAARMGRTLVLRDGRLESV